MILINRDKDCCLGPEVSSETVERLPRLICCTKHLFVREIPFILTDISPLRVRIIYVSCREWRTKTVFSARSKIQGKHLKSPADLSDVPELNARASSTLLYSGAHRTGFCSSLGVSFWCSAVFYKEPQSAHVPLWKRKMNTSKERIALGFNERKKHCKWTQRIRMWSKTKKSEIMKTQQDYRKL